MIPRVGEPSSTEGASTPDAGRTGPVPQQGALGPAEGPERSSRNSETRVLPENRPAARHARKPTDGPPPAGRREIRPGAAPPHVSAAGKPENQAGRVEWPRRRLVEHPARSDERCPARPGTPHADHGWRCRTIDVEQAEEPGQRPGSGDERLQRIVSQHVCEAAGLDTRHEAQCATTSRPDDSTSRCASAIRSFRLRRAAGATRAAPKRTRRRKKVGSSGCPPSARRNGGRQSARSGDLGGGAGWVWRQITPSSSRRAARRSRTRSRRESSGAAMRRLRRRPRLGRDDSGGTRAGSRRRPDTSRR